MKNLYLIRHAKSSWSFELPDFHRPLGKRGRNDVIKVGKILKKKYSPPDIIITSPASRAFYTALYYADAWNYDEERIVINEQFYHGGSDNFWAIFPELEEFGTVAYAGHNPGLTNFANELTQEYTENIPTGAVMHIAFPAGNWADVTKKSGQIKSFLTPKSL